jgi:DNA-binding GntR family transcriptional regulator
MQKRLDRPNLTDLLADDIRRRIVDGDLPAGTRINEVHLAASLGVSRTPLREALGRLVAEGTLTTIPRIGFFVAPLSIEEFEQIYPIRALLDPEALRLSGVPSPEELARLRAINEQIRATTDVDERIRLDDEWHRELIARCPNRVLLALINQFINRTRRYEMALMRETRNVEISTRTHERIMAALRRRELDTACALLRENMQSGLEPIREWLRNRNQGKDS